MRSRFVAVLAVVPSIAWGQTAPSALSQLRAGGSAETVVPAVGNAVEIATQNKSAQSAAPEGAPLTTLWGTVEGGLPGPAAETLSIRDWKKGVIHRHHYKTYVVRVAPENTGAYTAAGFQPLTEITVALRWARVSDINGWGTEVNGEIHRAWEWKPTFSGAELDGAFLLLKKFMRDPIALLREAKGADHVLQRGEVVLFERGFVVDSSIGLLTGHEWTGGETILYQAGSRSGYYR